MKILGYIIAGIALIAVVILGAGMALPKQHTAAVRANYRATPEQIFETITAVEQGPQWRTGLDSVRVLASDPLTWREAAEWGTLTLVMAEAAPPARVVTRIAEETEGFGGTWTYEIAPDATGSVVVITERGTVDNPLFRFMSKFVFGHYTGLETYARDLGRKFNQSVEPERVKQP